MTRTNSEKASELVLSSHYGLSAQPGVIDVSGNVTESSDYYSFGRLQMPGRGFLSGNIATKEGFTGKEQDGETGWQYFGARYYHPALGKWLAVDPLADDFPSWSPYNYVYNSPLKYNDPNGLWPNLAQLYTIDYAAKIFDDLSTEMILDIGSDREKISQLYNNKPLNRRYVALENTGSEFLQSAYATATTIIDMQHFLYAATNVINYKNIISGPVASFFAVSFGDGNEAWQLLWGGHSGNSPEDRLSNILGAEFGLEYDPNSKKTFKQQLVAFLVKKGVLNDIKELEKRKKTIYKKLPKNNEELEKAHKKWKKKGVGVVFNFSRTTNYDVENGVAR